MDITVNQQNYSFSEACSLQQMLQNLLLHSSKGIAIAVNQEIISRGDWQTFQLKTHDQITIIKATQGG